MLILMENMYLLINDSDGSRKIDLRGQDFTR